MKTVFKFLSFAAVLAVSASPAAHATVAYNSSLTQGPGVYFASTTANSGFDVVTDGTLQLGLEAITRHIGPITPDANNYFYSPGPGTPASLSTWDFEFSVNTGTAPLSTYSYDINILDVTTGQHVDFDPTLLPDNGQSSGSTVVCNGNPSCAYNGANTGFQNAENLGFSFLSTPFGGFNPNAADTYQITLSATPGSGSVVSDTINVIPTPEPSSLVFLGTGLVGGIGTMLRRRRIA